MDLLEFRPVICSACRRTPRSSPWPTTGTCPTSPPGRHGGHLNWQRCGTADPREQEVLAAVRRGMTNPQIATELFLFEGTVKCHVKQVLRKLNVRTGKEVDVPVGRTIMEASVRKNLPGTIAECCGSCSCATCHVLLAATSVVVTPSLLRRRPTCWNFSKAPSQAPGWRVSWS
ncbi:LuxR C-terminal-related transcriptional regulator [bacterium RCC_150]